MGEGRQYSRETAEGEMALEQQGQAGSASRNPLGTLIL